MGKESEKEKNTVAVGGIASFNCADVKFFITALLFLCSLATVLQFFPSRLSFSLPSPPLLPDCSTDRLLVFNHSILSPPLLQNDAGAVNNPLNLSRQQNEVLENGVINPSMPRQQNGVLNQLSALPRQQNGETNPSTMPRQQNGVVDDIENLPRQQNEVLNQLSAMQRQQNGVVIEDGVTKSMPRQQNGGLNPSMPRQQDEVGADGIVKRGFNPYGAAAYAFILMSAYRGGPNTFAVNALASKPLHVFGKPTYLCRYVEEREGGGREVTAVGVRYLPDWGYGRVYTVVVVNCTFSVAVGVEGGGGGRLVVEATTNGGGDSKVNVTDTIEALYEAPGSLNLSYFTSPPKYDYLYCGSPLYGDLSPQRVREWIAYHVRFFGEKSHFVIHDAGGIHADVLAVLRPWIEKRYVTLNDVREQERFDGYYHNQFLIVNDCLHRYRFDAKWMFFFDVDEFMFVPKKKTIKSVTDSLLDYTQFTIQQMPMSGKLCLDDGGRTYKKWGFEKLAYRDSRTRIRRDRKYAVQPRNILATGVHMSENIVGKTTHKTEGLIKYYHYHGTIAQRREPCRQLLNTTGIPVEGIPYVMDTTMRDIGATVKRFELKMIGPILQKTQQ